MKLVITMSRRSEPVQVSLQMNFPKDWTFLSMTVPILNSRSMTACMTPRQKPSVSCRKTMYHSRTVRF